MKPTKVTTFNEFWPMYLRAHASRASQAAHFTGIALSAVTAAAMISCGMVFFLVLAAVPALIGAKIGHRLNPRKDPVSAEHPDWAVFADVKMFVLFVVGRLGRELATVSELPSRPALSTS
jgi:hypothetical protein